MSLELVVKRVVEILDLPAVTLVGLLGVEYTYL